MLQSPHCILSPSEMNMHHGLLLSILYNLKLLRKSQFWVLSQWHSSISQKYKVQIRLYLIFFFRPYAPLSPLKSPFINLETVPSPATRVSFVSFIWFHILHMVLLRNLLEAIFPSVVKEEEKVIHVAGPTLPKMIPQQHTVCYSHAHVKQTDLSINLFLVLLHASCIPSL